MQRLEREPQALHRTRAKVLHQHVGRGNEAAQHGLTLVVGEIDDDRALVAIVHGELTVQAITGNPKHSALHVTARFLDLHHICALVAQN